ncbi:MAG: site-2 protease family protein [Planctomycetaceae bacterium]|jgi:Zn-dependent protease|nr:site-2 protease family protein [Planctomycetaceae bacterium]
MYQQTPYDISFRFLGFPVRIQPFFWLVIALLGIPHGITNLSIQLIELMLWVAAAFVSILVHELGHALVFRHVYRVSSQIIFHGMGGVTIPFVPHHRRYGFFGMLCELFLFAAGPFASFVLAGLFLVLLLLLPTVFQGAILESELEVNGLSALSIVVVFMWKVVSISIVWGIFNLFPIYPMDGGQISREIFSYFSSRNGVANSLVLSMVIAILFAVLAFRFGLVFMAFLFAYFAYQNYQELSYYSFRRR